MDDYFESFFRRYKKFVKTVMSKVLTEEALNKHLEDIKKAYKKLAKEKPTDSCRISRCCLISWTLNTIIQQKQLIKYANKKTTPRRGGFLEYFLSLPAQTGRIKPKIIYFSML